MKDLIEALQIFLKYGNPSYPTHCIDDVLIICSNINPQAVTKDDISKLSSLGFDISSDFGEEQFASFKFG